MFIVFLLLLTVECAVQFDNESSFVAHKIDDVSPQRGLSAKSETVKLAPTNPIPQDSFFNRCLVAKDSCEVAFRRHRFLSDGFCRHGPETLIPPIPGPSPAKGEGREEFR